MHGGGSVSFNYLAIIQGGIGPDVWDKELHISAVDFRDAASQAAVKAEELGDCQVVTLEQNDVPMDTTKWLIWSNEHKSWWAANELGYVKKRSEAGRYSYRKALNIVAGANGKRDYPDEAMVLDA